MSIKAGLTCFVFTEKTSDILAGFCPAGFEVPVSSAFPITAAMMEHVHSAGIQRGGEIGIA